MVMNIRGILSTAAALVLGTVALAAQTDGKGGFARGADVGWLTELEQKGYKFHPRGSSDTMELMQLLRDHAGVNAVRLRVWVSPDDYFNGLGDVVHKALRAHRLGMRLMIDFHFSDTWADPGHQEMPRSWRGKTLSELEQAVAEHVTVTLNALRALGIKPEWVQIGNETTPGMMLPVGSTENPESLTALNNAGYDAVKKVLPDAKVIVHLDNGNDPARYDRMFDILHDNGGRYDMIGMSLYPFWVAHNGGDGRWQTVAQDCMDNIDRLKKKYGKPVMICEIGMPYNEAQDCRDLIATMLKADVEGVFYWEPEAPAGYNGGYTLGCFDNGAPTIALDAFVEDAATRN